MSWNFKFVATSRQAALDYLDGVVQNPGVDIVRSHINSMVDFPGYGVSVETYGHLHKGAGAGVSTVFCDVKQISIVSNDSGNQGPPPGK
jgi:hypothetical protein